MARRCTAANSGPVDRSAGSTPSRGFEVALRRTVDPQIAAYNDLISRFADSQNLRVRRMVAKAFLEKGRVLGTLAKTEDQVEVYHEFLKGASGSSGDVIQEFVSDALLAMGHTLAVLKKPVEAIATLEELIEVQMKLRWGMPPRRFAEILLCKAKVLELAGSKEEAGAVYQELLGMGATMPGSLLWLVPFAKEASGSATLQQLSPSVRFLGAEEL